MGLASRLLRLANGSVDRALTAAEQAVGLRPRDQSGTNEPAPADPPKAPFFEPDTDWGQNGSLYQYLEKGVQGVELRDDEPARKPKALAHDPFQLVELLGYKERPTGLAFSIIDQMVARTPVIQTIHHVRVTQVAQFCRVQESPYAIGFRIRHRDSKKNLTRAAKKRAHEIEQALLNTTTGEPGIGRDNFATFTKKCIAHSLKYDQAAYEVVPSKRGKPHSWQAVDGKSIRLADTLERFDYKPSDEQIRTVQILQGQVVREFSAQEMAFMVRNPDPSLQAQGYGISEVERLIHVITSLLWSFEYNQRFFSQGAGQKGILNFKGNVPQRQLAAFRRFFYQMIAGVNNSWRTPIMNAEQGVEWISMHSNNRDMEFSAWMDWLIKLACAAHLMDPLEIGFKYGNENDRSMFESANEQKVTQSKDKGLKPLVREWGESLNKMIVEPLEPDFCLEFLGLDALTPKEQADLDEAEGRTYLMVDELRERKGLAPLEDGLGQVINSPTWMQYKQSRDAAAQEAQMPGGPEGADPDGEAPAGPEPKTPSLQDLLRGGHDTAEVKKAILEREI